MSGIASIASSKESEKTPTCFFSARAAFLSSSRFKAICSLTLNLGFGESSSRGLLGELGELGLDFPVEGTRSLAGVFGVVGNFGVAGVVLCFTGDAVERMLL